jgi:hypothetical protein
VNQPDSIEFVPFRIQASTTFVNISAFPNDGLDNLCTDLVAGEQPLGVPINHNNILKDDFIYRPDVPSPFG